VPLPTGAAAEQAIGAYLAPEPRVWGQAPRTLRTRPQLRKIAALLYDGGRPWGYALSLARRIAKKERLELCSDADLAKIIAALAIDQQRRQRRTTGRP
jgi:phage gp16-like protein